MAKYYLVLSTFIIIISSASFAQDGTSKSYLTRGPTFTPSTYVDIGAWLPAPNLNSVVEDSNAISDSEDILFATHSFSHAGTTYNIEFYYRKLFSRLRARVLVGDRELHGLLNRFYNVDMKNRTMLSVYGRDAGKPEFRFNFGRFTLVESDIDTDAIYDALETFAEESGLSTWIRLYEPPGMLKKTCRASLGRQYLVNEQGQIGRLTLENLLIAYCQEEITAVHPEDFDRIGRSLVEVHGNSMGLINTIVSDVNDVRRYSRRLLESVDAGEIRPPAHFSDDENHTDHWNCYACARYKMGPAVFISYKFGFRDGLLYSGERTILGENASGSHTGYPNLKKVRAQEKVVLNQTLNFKAEIIETKTVARKNSGFKNTIDTKPLLSMTVIRIVFVVGGIIVLVLALVVRKYVRIASQVPKKGTED